MRILAAACVGMMLAGLVVAQEPETGVQPAAPRAFSLDLESYPLGSYEASKELRLAVWDSPMTRLEFGVAREMYAARMGGIVGLGTPMGAAFRMSVGPAAPARLVFAGPWSEQWHQLEWKDQLAVAAESAFVIGVLAAVAHNLH
ncbi:MAG TPA: hypothetical protein PLS53_14820 [Thermoanaerobaculaceae bacterium]|nr:hypothetical protein [Thermoanaerobaculaceae bacterium]HPS79430.1 hypothetical protein [Thermoanaerobaculaceae bacterium]